MDHYQVVGMPKPAGYFDWGLGVHWHMTHKPNAWQRLWYRAFLGWKWVDVKGDK